MIQTCLSKIRCNQEVLLRLLVIVALGYPLTALVSIVISQILPLSKADSVAAASMLSFAIYTAYIMWAFAAKSWQKVAYLSVMLMTAMAACHSMLNWALEAI
ncbi:iron transporter [Pseudoalteromonas sp. S16_S37]|uniref:iron transporter n=1 Tax=Pseudoalteromonas sp. S16_S37 TaxID=2720228 RepID=UPI0016814967|nr:iron transporter [Pseudoalteromonas sp. S16_S37]MBD1584290.1 iron transporter [Pseudoalteromonas sp. S16_S37]